MSVFFCLSLGERRLDRETNIMSLFRVNPHAEWVIRKLPHPWCIGIILAVCGQLSSLQCRPSPLSLHRTVLYPSLACNTL